MVKGQKVQRKGKPSSQFEVIGGIEDVIFVRTTPSGFGAGARMFAFYANEIEIVQAPPVKAAPGVIYESDGLIYVGLTNGKVMDTTWDKEHDYDPGKMKVVPK